MRNNKRSRLAKLFDWADKYRWSVGGYNLAIIDVLAFMWVLLTVCLLIAMALYLIL
jgi:hypothetical protein